MYTLTTTALPPRLFKCLNAKFRSSKEKGRYKNMASNCSTFEKAPGRILKTGHLYKRGELFSYLAI